MTVFDDPHVRLEVGGIEVDPQQLADEIRAEEANPSRISWPVVDRWCRDHPLQVRLFPARTAQTTTYLRKRYPHLSTRSVHHRPRPGSTATWAQICDVMVVFVPEGEVDPLNSVPGIPMHTRRSGGASRT